MRHLYYSLLLLATVTVASTEANAQMTMGANTLPQNFSVLELISGGNKGLRLPQLTIAQRDDLQATFGAEATGKAMGLQIFNTKTKCVETWNGAAWIQACPPSGPAIPPVSPTPAASCGVTASNGNTTFTCIADPNAESYEWFFGGVSQGETTSNSITFGSAQTPANVSVAYLYPPAFLKPTMIDVAGGTFTIGAAVAAATEGVVDNGAFSGSGSVTLSSFKMSETPVTQAQFSAVFSGKGTSTTSSADSYYFVCAQDIDYAPSSAKPAENISWYDVIAYCNKLSIMEGKTPVYTVSGVNFSTLTYAQIPTGTNPTWDAVAQNLSADGYRLPTEAEWEYAARGGDKSLTALGTPPDYYYSGSNTANDVAWHAGNNIGGSGSATYGTKPVKGKSANALGLYDMSGNIYEWCWNWYTSSYVDNEKGSNPVGVATGSYRVGRGGSWGNTATTNCRVSFRNSSTPYVRNSGVGFRVVVAP